MKKLFLFLGILFSLQTFSQVSQRKLNDNSLVTRAEATYPFLGVVYQANSFPDTTLWTSSGAGFSIVSNKLHITAGNNAGFTTYVSYKDTSCINHFRIYLRGKLTSVMNTTDQGVSIGVRCINSFSTNQCAWTPDWRTTGTPGQPTFYTEINNGCFCSLFQMAAGSKVVLHQNDEVIMVMERENQKFHCYIYDTTTHLASSDTVFSMPMSGGAIPPNTYLPTIWTHGGTFDVDSFAYVKFEAQNADLAVVGDSRFMGYGATVYTNSIAYLMQLYYANSVVLSGFGDRTGDVRNRIQEVIKLRPKNCILAVGRNDIANSVATGTWQANISYIDSALVANNIHTIWVECPQEVAGVNVTPVNQYLWQQFPTKIIPWYTRSREASLYYTDNIHFSDKGQRIYWETIKSSLQMMLNSIDSENPDQ